MSDKYCEARGSSPTHNHEGEFKALLDRLAVDLIREVGKAHITCGLRKLENNIK